MGNVDEWSATVGSKQASAFSLLFALMLAGLVMNENSCAIFSLGLWL